MLATARLGAIHSVVFGGFASNELAKRLDDAKPKVVVSSSCGVEPGRIVAYKPLLDKAIEIAAHKPESCIILQRPIPTAQLHAGRDHDWARLVADAKSQGLSAECVAVQATDPLYILYTSGSNRRAQGHRARQWRSHGRSVVVDAESFTGSSPARCSGPHPTSAGSSDIPISSMGRSWPAMRPSSTKASPSERPTLAHFGASQATESCVPLYRADGAACDQEGGFARRHHPKLRPFWPAHAVPGRRARRSCYRCSGPSSTLRCR